MKSDQPIQVTWKDDSLKKVSYGCYRRVKDTINLFGNFRVDNKCETLEVCK